MMNIEVWTDGRLADGRYTSTALVITEDTFIMRVVKEGDAKVPFESELYAILEVLRYLASIDTSGFRHINIYTDAAFVTLSFNLLAANRKIKKTIKFREVFLEMLDLAEMIEGTLAMITYPSHQVEHNPNKTCDITCRIISKAFSRKEEIQSDKVITTSNKGE